MKAKILATWITFFILGTIFAFYFELNPALWLTMAAVFVGSSIFTRNRIIWTLLIAIGFFFLAILLFQKQQQKYTGENLLVADQQELVGTIVDVPQETEKGVQARIGVQNKTLLAYLRPYPTVEFADKVNIKGKVKNFTPEKQDRLIKDKLAGEISVSEIKILGKDNSFSIRAKGILFWLRINMNKAISRALPKEEAGLASGLILGEKALITAEVKRDLQASGTSHIIALSGYNITIILGLFAFLKNKYSRLVNLLMPTLFILSFVVMTGASASIVRAAIMGFMPLLARYIGRPANSVMAILVSAFVMLLFNPYLALFDVGFQLSFLAMIGLTTIGPLILGFFENNTFLVSIFAETVSAQIAVLPLIVYYFGVVSVISPVSNLVILSFVPFGMFVSFVTGAFGIIHPVLGKLAGLFSYPLLRGINLLVSFFGRLSFAAFPFKLDSLIWLFIFYAVIFDLAYILRAKRARQVV